MPPEAAEVDEAPGPAGDDAPADVDADGSTGDATVLDMRSSRRRTSGRQRETEATVHHSRQLKPGEARKHRRIDTETYNGMWRAFVQVQTTSYVVKTVGVSIDTARRYIEGPADPDRGMVPLRDRFLRVQARTQSEEEASIVSYRRNQMALVRKGLDLLGDEMTLAVEDVKLRIADYSARGADAKATDKMPELRTSIDKLTSSIDRLVRLGDKLHGGADGVYEHKHEGERFAEWNPEEMIEYATTGILPAHARGVDKGVEG
jgi:hypothetical protein